MREITYVHTRVRTTDYIYDVELDGEWVAAACNHHAAELVAQDVEARQQLLALIEDAVKQARQQATYTENTKTQEPTGWCYICGSAAWDWDEHGPLCPDHFGVWEEWQQAQADQDVPPVEQARQQTEQAQAEQGNLQAQIDQGWDYAECPCGAQALYFVQYADRVYAYCPECWQHREAFTLPLLGQCARLLDSLLGGPVANGGILDEVRRLRARLAQEGW